MPSTSGWKTLWLGVPYAPDPTARSFLDRAVVREDDDCRVEAAVLDDHESDRFFGVPLARRGVQPVWLKISNRGRNPTASGWPASTPTITRSKRPTSTTSASAGGWCIRPARPALYAPAAPAAVQALGAAGPTGGWTPSSRTRHRLGPDPARRPAGGVRLHRPRRRHQAVQVRLLGPAGAKEYAFRSPSPACTSITTPNSSTPAAGETVACDEAALRERLDAMPRATTNHLGTREGDPLNLVVVGQFDTILAAFGARWDETETISLRSCRRTLTAFSLGSRYRYSPVSRSYAFGRSQDFALRRRGRRSTSASTCGCG